MPSAPEPKLDALIQGCSLQTAQACFRKLCPGDFKRLSEELENPDEDRFAGFTQFGELPLDGESLFFAYADSESDITERSARKAQFDAARDLLKARGEYDAGIFIFRGPNGAFRLSFITKIYKGTKANFSHFRRYTYFVDPATDGNGTFIRQVGGCSFDSLLAIQEAFSVEAINKDFYKELANWYFWAMKHVHFPTDDVALDKKDIFADKQKVREHDAKNLIRLLTRMLFIWFIKQRGLVPHELFDAKIVARDYLDGFSTDYLDGFASPSRDTRYYKAILQNFFFAVLNQERGKREFRKMGAAHRDNMCLMRYKDAFKDPQRFLDTVEATTPFLNGGLFECLDFLHPTEKGPSGGAIKCYEDGFSDHKDNPLVVPDFLFFAPEHKTDLSDTWGIPSKNNETVQGLIYILNRYNFTIVENSPIEQEVALDPELLGKVFENLLASYNPETQTTARKQTGSFYTPRPIVDYMVDESLKAYLLKPLTDDAGMNEIDAKAGLDLLFSYEEKDMDTIFETKEVDVLIRAIDRCKILDPACGSGAFPMGVLQKLVFVLGKLDPSNEKWEQRQIDEAQAIEDKQERRDRIREIMQDFEDNDDDYGRKLYLIENCLYGVDIQSIATQVSKLRFFISLVVDQNIDRAHPDGNFGVRPLPNLETKFVAADTLIAIEKPGVQKELYELTEVKKLQDELQVIRHKIFSVKTTTSKQKYKADDKAKREEIAAALKTNGWPDTTADRLAKWDPYKQNDSADYFDPEWMFGLKGFDVVIGNPPYISVEEFSGTDLQQKWKNLYLCYSGRSDLYCFFYERGLQLLQPEGTLSYITSNKFLKSGYGKNLRQLLSTHSIQQLINFGELPVFEASADPIISCLRKRQRSVGEFMKTVFVDDEAKILQLPKVMAEEAFNFQLAELGSESWNIAADDGGLLQKIKSGGKSLSEYFPKRIYSGIKTGRNSAFWISEEQRKSIIKDDPASAEIIKPLLRGRDIQKWRCNSPSTFLIYTHSATRIEDFPGALRHLSQHRESLESRASNQQWWQLQQAQYNGGIWDKPKILYPDICKSSRFALSLEPNYSDMKGFVLECADKYLLGILNSTVVWWFLVQTCSPLGDPRHGGRLQLKTQYTSKIPIPPASISEKAAIEKLVDDIMDVTETDPLADVSETEMKINLLVYKLFKLTPEEVAIIENS